jgi:hypothetical protein
MSKAYAQKTRLSMHVRTASPYIAEDWELEPGAEAESYEIVDGRAVADVIRSCRRTRPLVRIRTADDTWRVGRLLGPDDENDGVAVAIDGDGIPDGPCSARFGVHDVLFILRGHLRQRAGGTAISRPFRLFGLDRRGATRTSLANGRAELVWWPVDSDNPGPVRSSVRDFSPVGVGVIADEGDPLPNTIFAARLRIGASVVSCLAQARRRSAAPGQTSGVGIHVGSGAEGLIALYLAELLPKLAPRRSVDCESMRRLMTESGYLQLRDSNVEFQA